MQKRKVFRKHLPLLPPKTQNLGYKPVSEWQYHTIICHQATTVSPSNTDNKHKKTATLRLPNSTGQVSSQHWASFLVVAGNRFISFILPFGGIINKNLRQTNILNNFAPNLIKRNATYGIFILCNSVLKQSRQH